MSDSGDMLTQSGQLNLSERWPFSSDPADRGAASWLALRLGVVSMLGGILFGWTLPLAIAAVVIGGRALRARSGHRGNSIGAIVFGLIGTLFSLAWIVYSLVTLRNALA